MLDSVANVLCPACKLWNTGHGANMMREAVSLMGGYGITEDCPGFLGHKWMDAQLEATYEGPEAVQRRQLSVTMTDELFLAQFRNWIGEMKRQIASTIARAPAPARSPPPCRCGSGPSIIVQKAADAEGARCIISSRQGGDFPAGRCALLAAGSRPRSSMCWNWKPKAPKTRPGQAPSAAFSPTCAMSKRPRCRRSGPHLRRTRVRLQPPSRVGCEACATCYQAKSWKPGRHHPRHRQRRARLHRRHRSRRLASRKAGPCAQIRRPTTSSAACACETGWLPHRIAASPRTAPPKPCTKVMIPEALDYPA
jgi:hypothetical protein